MSARTRLCGRLYIRSRVSTPTPTSALARLSVDEFRTTVTPHHTVLARSLHSDISVGIREIYFGTTRFVHDSLGSYHPSTSLSDNRPSSFACLLRCRTHSTSCRVDGMIVHVEVLDATELPGPDAEQVRQGRVHYSSV